MKMMAVNGSPSAIIRGIEGVGHAPVAQLVEQLAFNQ